MASKKGNSLLETRRRNRVLIKNMIFRMENARRTAIAEELGLTLPTITTSVNEMLSEGILEEIPMSEGQLVNNMGRRPNAIAFRAEAAYAIGVELGPYATRAVLMDLRGNALEALEFESATENYAGMLEKVTNIVKTLAEKAEGKNLLGVGVGLPGFIDRENGVIRSNPRKDWTGRTFSSDLEAGVGIPVFIDNNVRIRAVGYEMSMHGQKPDSFAYFFISRGVACPVMLKDDVVSGYTAGAGEIGHTVIFADGELKCVDELGGEGAIFARCQEAMLDGRLKELKELMQQDGCLKVQHILTVQEQGCRELNQIVDEAIGYLGIALANVVNLINPGYVVADSCLFCIERNQKKLLETAKQNFYGLNEEEVQVIFAPFEWFRGAKGAAYFLIREQFLNK